MPSPITYNLRKRKEVEISPSRMAQEGKGNELGEVVDGRWHHTCIAAKSFSDGGRDVEGGEVVRTGTDPLVIQVEIPACDREKGQPSYLSILPAVEPRPKVDLANRIESQQEARVGRARQVAVLFQIPWRCRRSSREYNTGLVARHAGAYARCGEASSFGSRHTGTREVTKPTVLVATVYSTGCSRIESSKWQVDTITLERDKRLHCWARVAKIRKTWRRLALHVRVEKLKGKVG
ncbi:hypothetical protein M501DRAFT_1032337 [Patellaria atrata CBS 101060]|uniref:Uncharacterized protein n=1 Tax=Patellaria atrata CBS 101060 TaxID=1346257 RepID=A0A9P4S9F3_9PEZI|nr:hypothetical protein M501DRAFT_1032337 [Patellaria atrata CBS 101060]